MVEVDPRSPRSDDCLDPGSLSPRSPMTTLERGCSPSSVPPSPPSELSCFSTLSSSPRRSDVSLLQTPRPVQADSKVSTKEAMSPSPLNRVSSTLYHFVRLLSHFARLSSNKTYQNSNQNRSSQSFKHITSPLFVFASCLWSLRYSNRLSSMGCIYDIWEMSRCYKCKYVVICMSLLMIMLTML